MPWEEVNLDLLPAIKRNNASPEEQAALATAEHQAAARNIVGDNPLMAVPFAVATPLYQARKLIYRAEGETPASVEQLKAGFKGIGEGLERALKNLMPWQEVNKPYDPNKPVKKKLEPINPASIINPNKSEAEAVKDFKVTKAQEAAPEAITQSAIKGLLKDVNENKLTKKELLEVKVLMDKLYKGK